MYGTAVRNPHAIASNADPAFLRSRFRNINTPSRPGTTRPPLEVSCFPWLSLQASRHLPRAVSYVEANDTITSRSPVLVLSVLTFDLLHRSLALFGSFGLDLAHPLSRLSNLFPLDATSCLIAQHSTSSEQLPSHLTLLLWPYPASPHRFSCRPGPPTQLFVSGTDELASSGKITLSIGRPVTSPTNCGCL